MPNWGGVLSKHDAAAQYQERHSRTHKDSHVVLCDMDRSLWSFTEGAQKLVQGWEGTWECCRVEKAHAGVVCDCEGAAHAVGAGLLAAATPEAPFLRKLLAALPGMFR